VVPSNDCATVAVAVPAPPSPILRTTTSQECKVIHKSNTSLSHAHKTATVVSTAHDALFGFVTHTCENTATAFHVVTTVGHVATLTVIAEELFPVLLSNIVLEIVHVFVIVPPVTITVHVIVIIPEPFGPTDGKFTVSIHPEIVQVDAVNHVIHDGKVSVIVTGSVSVQLF
jgi:hypothetical protein